MNIVCSNCGSANVYGNDATVVWSPGKQCWIIGAEPSTVDCHECDHVGEPSELEDESTKADA